MDDRSSYLEPLTQAVTFRPYLVHALAASQDSPRAREGGAPPVPADGAQKPEPSDLPEFERIYDEHFDLVWRLLLRLGVPQTAVDDALQDVFLVVYRRLSEFEGRSTLRTWIIGITLRVGSDYLRRRRRTDALVSATSTDLRDDSAPDPLEQTARTEAVRLLYQLLDELDSDKRAVFVLAEIEQMSIRDIASLAGVNSNTVGSRLKAARRQFQAALARHRARDGWRSHST